MYVCIYADMLAFGALKGVVRLCAVGHDYVCVYTRTYTNHTRVSMYIYIYTYTCVYTQACRHLGLKGVVRLCAVGMIVETSLLLQGSEARCVCSSCVSVCVYLCICRRTCQE